jgi:hypothetical protein
VSAVPMRFVAVDAALSCISTDAWVWLTRCRRLRIGSRPHSRSLGHTHSGPANSLSLEMLGQLRTAIRSLEPQEGKPRPCDAIFLTSSTAPRIFCAGLELSELYMGEGDVAAMKARGDRLCVVACAPAHDEQLTTPTPRLTVAHFGVRCKTRRSRCGRRASRQLR